MAEILCREFRALKGIHQLMHCQVLLEHLTPCCIAVIQSNRCKVSLLMPAWEGGELGGMGYCIIYRLIAIVC